MTINEILSEVTILKDCSVILTVAFAIITGGVILVGVGIWCIYTAFSNDLSILMKINSIVMVIIGLGCSVYGFWSYFTRPVEIDYYICTNDVKIEQLMEYFDISELSQIDDSIVCHITPKAEYYNEVLALRDSRKGD